jgi:outer membrane murein-binding lipoprotein Lpp
VNQAHFILDILVGVAALTVAVVVGRDNIKKRTIEELQALVVALTQKIDILENSVDKCRDANTRLKETVDGYAELVREGYLTGFDRSRRRDGSTDPKTTTNRKS